MAPTLHCIRHAQSKNNVKVEYQALLDPLLTPLGEHQCTLLRSTFPKADAADVGCIVASPLRRTLYTALYAFGDVIAATGTKVIALPELQETSDLRCDTGSPKHELEKEFADLPVDLSLLTEDWDSKTGRWEPTAEMVDARARYARLWLSKRPEKAIVVVTRAF